MFETKRILYTNIQFAQIDIIRQKTLAKYKMLGLKVIHI